MTICNKKLFQIILVCLVFTVKINSEVQTITTNIYADNYFEFYVNGNLVKKDPLDFTPHNGVKFSFNVTQGEKRVYAIKASDFATESGYEYTQTSNPQLGDGALRVFMSDGTASSKIWKCYTISYGPTDESIKAGCSSSNLNACKIKINPEPTNWKELNYDDSDWSYATEYSESAAGWGRNPSYSEGKCGTLTDGLTRLDKVPSSIPTLSDECLIPQNQIWGNSTFIWQGDLQRDNTILCRLVTDSSYNGTSIGGNFEKINLIVFLLILVILI